MERLQACWLLQKRLVQLQHVKGPRWSSMIAAAHLIQFETSRSARRLATHALRLLMLPLPQGPKEEVTATLRQTGVVLDGCIRQVCSRSVAAVAALAVGGAVVAAVSAAAAA